MKSVVFTLGCKVNSYESACLVSGLSSLGFEVSDRLSFADLYIINTCAVTKEAEKKSRQAIARVKSYNPSAKIIVTGCAAQHNPKSFYEKEGVYLVCGAINKDKIISLIEKEGIFIEDSNEYYQEFLPERELKTRAYVKVEDGCNNFCSYCLIPHLRGRCRSRSVESVKKELDAATAKEIVITGINLSAYNYGGNDLADLINGLKEYSIRFRLGSLEENVISDKLLTALSGLKSFAPHFHLSLQSGSDKVLKDMNRHYDREDFYKSVENVRNIFPNAAITTDIIVGYPTETDEDFEETLKLCESVEFADIHCFIFSPREGTVAYGLKQLSPQVCDERLQKLLEIKNKSKRAFTEKFIGKTLSVLPEEAVDGYVVGYSENYVRCYYKGEVEENFVDVKVVGVFRDGALCEKI